MENNVAVVTIVAIVGIVVMLMQGEGITGYGVKEINIPDEQCNTLAANLDNAADGRDYEITYNGHGMNPCTNTQMDYTSGYDHEGFFFRRVYSNGDAVGQVGNTDYIYCGNGKAEVSNMIRSYYARGIAYGLWWNSAAARRGFVIEKCSTI